MGFYVDSRVGRQLHRFLIARFFDLIESFFFVLFIPM